MGEGALQAEVPPPPPVNGYKDIHVCVTPKFPPPQYQTSSYSTVGDIIAAIMVNLHNNVFAHGTVTNDDDD